MNTHERQTDIRTKVRPETLESEAETGRLLGYSEAEIRAYLDYIKAPS